MNSYLRDKRILIVVPSTSFPNDPSINGVKAKQIQEILQKCEKYNIKWKIATNEGKRPVINVYRDESSKTWLNNFLENEGQDDVLNLSDVITKNYDGIIIPNSINIYKEMKENSNLISSILLNFFNQKKPICCIGHSVYALTKMNENYFKEGGSNQYREFKWPLIGYNLSGTSIFRFINDNLFDEVESSVEELIILLGGNYVGIDDDINENQIISVEDRNLITGMDDSSFSNCLTILLNRLKDV